AAAIEAGRAQWPEIALAVGTLDRPPVVGVYDMLIVSFVLHWVDRTRLAASVAAIDGLIKPEGLLVLADFLPDAPERRRYHHRQDVPLYTYKQDYGAVFTGLGLYRELARVTYPHDATDMAIAPAASQDRAMCAVLRKTQSGYRET
ncbi:MAG: hypothetical protein D6782_09760, partial [Alphaproteobacteria bacterium]